MCALSTNQIMDALSMTNLRFIVRDTYSKHVILACEIPEHALVFTMNTSYEVYDMFLGKTITGTLPIVKINTT